MHPSFLYQKGSTKGHYHLNRHIFSPLLSCFILNFLSFILSLSLYFDRNLLFLHDFVLFNLFFSFFNWILINVQLNFDCQFTKWVISDSKKRWSKKRWVDSLFFIFYRKEKEENKNNLKKKKTHIRSAWFHFSNNETDKQSTDGIWIIYGVKLK